MKTAVVIYIIFIVLNIAFIYQWNTKITISDCGKVIKKERTYDEYSESFKRKIYIQFEEGIVIDREVNSDYSKYKLGDEFCIKSYEFKGGHALFTVIFVILGIAYIFFIIDLYYFIGDQINNTTTSILTDVFQSISNGFKRFR